MVNKTVSELLSILNDQIETESKKEPQDDNMFMVPSSNILPSVETVILELIPRTQIQHFLKMASPFIKKCAAGEFIPNMVKYEKAIRTRQSAYFYKLLKYCFKEN
jgi:hypothetical protein